MRREDRQTGGRGEGMKRRLINFLTAVSLALFVATAVLWIRSDFKSDRLTFTTVDNLVEKNRAIVSERWGIYIEFETTQFAEDMQDFRRNYYFYVPTAGFQWNSMSLPQPAG